MANEPPFLHWQAGEPDGPLTDLRHQFLDELPDTANLTYWAVDGTTAYGLAVTNVDVSTHHQLIYGFVANQASIRGILAGMLCPTRKTLTFINQATLDDSALTAGRINMAAEDGKRLLQLEVGKLAAATLTISTVAGIVYDLSNKGLLPQERMYCVIKSWETFRDAHGPTALNLLDAALEIYQYAVARSQIGSFDLTRTIMTATLRER